MKKYGVPMNIYGYVLPGASRLSRIPALSKEAKQRLKWFDWYHTHGCNARLTCRHFGLSPDVFYRWKGRYNPRDLTTLEDDHSNRTPHHFRPVETAPSLVSRIKSWRESHPRWGKKKIWKKVDGEGYVTSISTVGRTLTRLRNLGRLKEPAIVTSRLLGQRRRSRARPYAVRKPWGYRPELPGDLVEIDTVHIYPLPGVRRYQFTACDCVAKHTARIAASTITARSAVRVLDAVVERFPYPVRAIQIDGGSEFKGVFEAECQKRGLILYVLPIKSPKLNGVVERMQRTSKEEIYDLKPMPMTILEHNQLLEEEDRIYNHVRPHDALELLTPDEYYQLKVAV